MQAAKDSKKLAVSDEYKAISFTVDVTDAHGIQEMVQFALKEFARIDYLVNAAGVSISQENGYWC